MLQIGLTILSLKRQKNSLKDLSSTLFTSTLKGARQLADDGKLQIIKHQEL
jgi:hypothetical protein